MVIKSILLFFIIVMMAQFIVSQSTSDPSDTPPTQAPTEITNDESSSDFCVTIPAGVHRASSVITTSAGEFSFSLDVSQNDELCWDFADLCGSDDSITFTVNDVQKVFVPGVGSGCDGDISYTGEVFDSSNNPNNAGNAKASYSYDNGCPKYYTNLKSDFNPLLLPDSSLYIVDGSPSLQVNYKLPAYYYNVKSEYVDQCNILPSQSIASNADDGCYNDVRTSINYVAECPGFELVDNVDNNGETGYSYSGKLTISAKLDLVAGGYDVTRSVSSPLNWKVWITKTIEVSSDVVIDNDNACTTSAQCNENGCCEEGFCKCDCTEKDNGYRGTYCEEDNEPPTCDLGDDTLEIDSTHGGCVRIDAQILAKNPNFADNSGVFYSKRSTDINGQSDPDNEGYQQNNGDIQSICYGIGTHVITWNIQDEPFTNTSITDNEKASCSLTIKVADAGKPFVDCQQCQNAEDIASNQIAICQSATGANSFTRSVVKAADLKDYFNDNNFAVKDVAYPGSVAHGGYLSCDCSFDEGSSAPSVDKVTNSWNSWGRVHVWDVHDQNVQLNAIPTQTTDGTYPLVYSASDDAGNSMHVVLVFYLILLHLHVMVLKI